MIIVAYVDDGECDIYDDDDCDDRIAMLFLRHHLFVTDMGSRSQHELSTHGAYGGTGWDEPGASGLGQKSVRLRGSGWDGPGAGGAGRVLVRLDTSNRTSSNSELTSELSTVSYSPRLPAPPTTRNLGCLPPSSSLMTKLSSPLEE